MSTQRPNGQSITSAPSKSVSRGSMARPKNAPADPQPQSAQGSRNIRVLCVDDHAVLVEGLKAHFAIDGGIEVVGRLSSAVRLVDEVERLRPGVVLLDIEMPGPDAFEMADRLKRAYPDVRVVMLSAHVRDTFISQSLAAGVCGYFAKSDELEDIVRGIYEVSKKGCGSFVLGPKVRERCTPMAARGVRGALPGSTPGNMSVERGEVPTTLLGSLTAREVEILRLIGKGLSRVQIAAQLCRSAKTIDGHQDRLMKKLGIAARADLMRFAIREGLAEA